jgi:hypothetical protein
MLMAENQRRAILEALPPFGSMLEWGGGGSSAWFLSRMTLGQRFVTPGQTLVTVEHDQAWAQQIRNECGGYLNWELRCIPSSLEVGRNATHFEECPAGLRRYIGQADIDWFDVILVDGVARGACLALALSSAKPGASIFVHDWNREEWYEWALCIRRPVQTLGVIEAEEDYPGCSMLHLRVQ